MIRRSDEIRMMHDNGMTYDEISQYFGVSKQAVHQMAGRRGPGDGLHEGSLRKVKYPGLRNWLLTNRVSVRELERMCGASSFHASLIGNSHPTKKSIDAILAATGLTYEECFKEEENEV